MQHFSVLHLPHVTAMNGQVKVHVFHFIKKHRKYGHVCLHMQRHNTQREEGVAHLLIYRDDCLAFWLIVPPLLIVPSLACSVASLSLYPEP